MKRVSFFDQIQRKNKIEEKKKMLKSDIGENNKLYDFSPIFKIGEKNLVNDSESPQSRQKNYILVRINVASKFSF